MQALSVYAVPAMLFFFLVAGIWRRQNIFDNFLAGAADGVKTAFQILPSLVGMLVAVSMLKASGALDLLSAGLRPVAKAVGMPVDVLPLAILRPVSGSGGTALLEAILGESGPDSFSGRVASVIAGATETTFYTVAIYFGAVGIKKTRHTIPAAVSADLAGILMSAFAVRMLLGV